MKTLGSPIHRLMLILVAAAGVLCAVVADAGDASKESQSPSPRSRDRIDFVRDIQPILAKYCFECHGRDQQEGRLRLDAKQAALRGGFSGPAIVPGKSAESLLVRRIAGIGDEDRMPLDGEPLASEQIALLRAWIDRGAAWPEHVAANLDPEKRHWAYVKPVRPNVPDVADVRWIRNPIDAYVLARLEKAQLVPSPEAQKSQLIRRVTLDLTGLPPTLNEIDAFLADESANAYERLVDRLLASPRYGERWAVPWLDAARYADSNGYQRDGRRECWAFRDWVVRALNDDMPFDQFTTEQIAGDLLPEPSVSQLAATGFHRGTMANVEAGTDPEEEHVLAVIDRVNTTGTVWLGTTLACAQCHSHKYDPFSQQEYYRLYAFFNNTEKEIEATAEKSIREFVGPKITLPVSTRQQAERRDVKQRMDGLTERIDRLTAELKAEQETWEEELTEVPEPIREIIDVPFQSRSDEQKDKLTKYYLSQSQPYRQLEQELQTMQTEYDKLAPTTTLVMKELSEPRETRLFKRGDFLNPGAPMQPGTPAALHPLPEGEPRNRRALAEWLVDEDNPLVARVTVNRQWAEFFGRGLHETLEDFGTQSEPPTHPRLLDWLATELIRLGWSQKSLHRLIVISSTYRQSSHVTPQLLNVDPYNQLYARGPRFRLKAEFVRDRALAAAGLLSDKMYGPPVFPYQPPGVWNHSGRASNDWNTSTGEDRYRRGLYVYWRRTVPYPSFVNFDAPRRETCTVSRPVSNTPLQALTLMNDLAYFEAAVALARRAIAEPPDEASADERAAFAFRLVTGRRPNPQELRILVDRYRHELDRFQNNPQAAVKLAAKWKLPAETDLAQFAAWTHVANVLLNLDEFVTRG